MTIEHLYPVADKHAVQNVAFAVEWQGEISPQTLVGVHALASKLKDYFPVVELQQVLTININGTQKPQPNTAPGAVVYQRMDSFGNVASQLTIARQNITLVINDYSRWDAVLSLALHVLSIILPKVLPDKSISAIGLQYTDLFHWKDEPSNLNLREVFREDCPYIAKNIFELKSLWHSHHGYLVESDTPLKHSRLDNINVTMHDINGERSIQMLISHRAEFAKVIRGNSPAYMETIQQIEDYLHEIHKDILRRLFTEQVCLKINLQ